MPAGIQLGCAFRPSPMETRKPNGISGGFVLPSALQQVGGLVPRRRAAAEQRRACVAVSTRVSYTWVCSYSRVSLAVWSRAGRLGAWWGGGLRLSLQAYSTLQRPCQVTQKLFRRNQTFFFFPVIAVTKRSFRALAPLRVSFLLCRSAC